MENKNLLFDIIAPVYGLFYQSQKRRYRAALGMIKNMLDSAGCKKIIDIGCGTGALCAVLGENGYSVTGIDPAEKMLDTAIKKSGNSKIKFIKADILTGLPFEDKSFDVCIASYVAHGMKAHERKIMYLEMGRISNHFVILYDYNEKRSLLTNIIEWFEGGDYFNFIRSAKHELENHFHTIKIIGADIRASWYICTPEKASRK
ncbi:MAG: class I SAM-dependent methyltransferase [Eubacteriales bacterium]